MNLSLVSNTTSVIIEKRVENNEEKIHSLYYENAFKLGRIHENQNFESLSSEIQVGKLSLSFEEPTDSTPSNSIEKRVQNNEKRIFFKKLEYIFNLGKNYTLLKKQKALSEQKHFYLTQHIPEIKIIHAEQWKALVQRAQLGIQCMNKKLDSLIEELKSIQSLNKEDWETQRKFEGPNGKVAIFNYILSGGDTMPLWKATGKYEAACRYLPYLEDYPPGYELRDQCNPPNYLCKKQVLTISKKHTPSILHYPEKEVQIPREFVSKTQKLVEKIILKKNENSLLKQRLKNLEEEHHSRMNKLKVTIFEYSFKDQIEYLSLLKRFVYEQRVENEEKIPKLPHEKAVLLVRTFIDVATLIEKQLSDIIFKAKEFSEEFKQENSIEKK